MVWDLEADSCIYKHNERQLMRPASTMKLLTAITALDKLGGSYQFKTQLKYTGTIEEGVSMAMYIAWAAWIPVSTVMTSRPLSTA